MVPAADLVQHAGDGRIVGRAEHRRGVEAEAGGADRRQFPIGEMGREDEAGLVVVAQGDEMLDPVDLGAAGASGLSGS